MCPANVPCSSTGEKIEKPRNDRGRLIQRQEWQICDNRRIRRDRHDVLLVGPDRRFAQNGAMHLELRERMALEPLDEDKIDGLHPGEEVGQLGLRSNDLVEE